MPTRERVQQLIRLVEHGKIPEAIQEFYADDVVMQDNKHPPVVGKEANIERERRWVSSLDRVHENRCVSFAVDGDHVAIQWVHDYTNKGGEHLRLEEVAFQTWRGNQIARERFFYDTASMGQ